MPEGFATEGLLRWQVVGHGRGGEDELNHQTLGGRRPEVLAKQLSQFSTDSGINISPEHISLVGCSLAGDAPQKNYAMKFAQSLDNEGIHPASVAAYSSQITVNHEGRKHLVLTDEGEKVVLNKENGQWVTTKNPGKSDPAGATINQALGNKTTPELAIPDDVQKDVRVLTAVNQAEDFKQAMEQLYRKNALPAGEWLPVLGSLREDESRPGSHALQFINTARPELSPHTLTTDDRRIIDFVNNYNKNLAMVSKTHQYTAGQFTPREGM